MRNPYEVLGVQRDASAAAIKSAYRKLAKKHHPDTNRDDPKAATRFSEVNGAYEIVGDDDKRKQFDRGEIDADGKPRFQGFPGGGQGGGGFEHAFRGNGGGASFSTGAGGFEDILSSMFGGSAGARGGRRGAGGFDTAGMGMPDLDVAAAMTVSLEDAVAGAETRVRLPSGRELNVRIPAGVVSGQQIRLRGQGESAPGHRPGDVMITITVAPHPLFKIDGDDLRADLPVALYDAVLGGKVRVPTLTGAVDLSIPKNTSSGRTFRLKGKGLPKAGGAGDLLVTTRIMLPSANDAALESLMRIWRDQHPYDPRG